VRAKQVSKAICLEGLSKSITIKCIFSNTKVLLAVVMVSKSVCNTGYKLTPDICNGGGRILTIVHDEVVFVSTPLDESFVFVLINHFVHITFIFQLE
jgi:hypothetical protein